MTRLSGLEKLSGEFKNWIVGFVPNLKKLSKPDEIKTWITNDSVSRLNEVSKDLGEGKTAIIAILSEIKETNKVIKDITRIHKSGKSHQDFNITDWFSRKASKLDDAVSDIKTIEVKMRELLSAGTTKPVTTAGLPFTVGGEPAIVNTTATATTNVQVNTTPAKTGGGKGPRGVGTKGPKTGGTKGPSGGGGKGPGTGETVPPTPDNSIMVNLSDHEFYAKLAQRCQALVTDWSTELKEIYKKGKAKRSLGFDRSFNLQYLTPAIERLRRFTSPRHQVINLTNLEKDVRLLHEAFDHFMTTIKGQETKLTTDEKNTFRGLTQRVKNDLTQLEELIQEEEKKLASTATSATKAPREAATA